ncbi:glucan biosynthesis protein G [Albimonas sp. CAU 1670]|uniref:glucan biosynthesis protein n=1 Tax=Albimonas sp. CAU 1670 TaxID=3032599 RepID=UPI0023DA0F9C|nr:glucan biosynthesis protein G [Albimonas sp. CAU 1670]MDF2234033.1 glucan biosynthesis protein G [Albimonas sp. CAU 1670]
MTTREVIHAATWSLDRRRFIAGAGATALLSAAAASTTSAAARAEETAPAAFDFEDVVARARTLAGETYQRKTQSPGGPFADLGYDKYRSIRYREDRRIWRGENRGFELDLMAPGSIYTDRVNVSVIENGAARPLPFDASALHFDPERFGLPDGVAPEGAGEGLSWTGFRIRFPINRPEAMDEVAVFQGASYFRGVARNQIFGLSARALAIKTGAPGGEEFPIFTDFWVHRPDENAAEILVHALLDSPSVAGAYEFLVRPGAETTMDIRSVLIPRDDIAEIGVAPLTSMYYFGAKERGRVDDYRDAVHDSSGLQMLTGAGERLWRPVQNPATLQMSFFQDENPKGFGLVQRQREFAAYSDAEARYEKRPSAWVAPVQGWGKGGEMLVEIPTQSEFNDNIVSFWRPAQALEAGQTYSFDYRLYWCNLPPDDAPTARVVSTRGGRSIHEDGTRLLAVDFELGDRGMAGLEPRAESSGAPLENVHFYGLPGGTRARVVLRFAPPVGAGAEFRLQLFDTTTHAPVSETWLYRWTPS